MLGIDCDVLDQQVVLCGEENDEANNLAPVISDEDVAFAGDPSRGSVAGNRGSTTSQHLVRGPRIPTSPIVLTQVSPMGGTGQPPHRTRYQAFAAASTKSL